MQDVQDRVRQFSSRVTDELGSLVECIVLVGSHARGDARIDSDIDVWIIVGEIHNDILERVGRIVTGMGDGPEINPQCATAREVCAPGFRKGFSPVQLHLDGVVLHGQVTVPAPTMAEIRQDRDELAASVLMGARHWVTVHEPEEAIRRKLDKWLLKPLVWAIRYDVFLRTGRYWKQLDRLCEATVDTQSRRLVEAYRQCRHGGFAGDCMDVLNSAMGVCGRFLGTGIN